VGAVGFIPFIGEPFYPVTLIRVDPDTNEPIRGKDNLCIKCKVGKNLIKTIIKNMHVYMKMNTIKKYIFIIYRI